jgi:hypothetical protein
MRKVRHSLCCATRYASTLEDKEKGKKGIVKEKEGK